ncbi:MAG: E3 binding domain-containing protein, partial [Alphaproteobacteria bacterium]|nr:E3 binding domain-containing protein [Alphaproteobacteria bacterium]
MAIREVFVPHIGGFKDVGVIEVNISPGVTVGLEDPLIAIESDKATLEVPSPCSGSIIEVKVSVGDKVSEGFPICTMEVAEVVPETPVPHPPEAQVSEQAPASKQALAGGGPMVAAPSPLVPPPAPESDTNQVYADVYAGPGVRHLARELGVDLEKLTGSGPHGRILKDDVHAYVKTSVHSADETSPSAHGGPEAGGPEAGGPEAGGTEAGEREATDGPEVDFTA